MDWDRFAADKRLENAVAAINGSGVRRPVKVCPHEPVPRASTGGWFGTEAFIIGRTPEEMERVLGLEAGYLARGADVYRFAVAVSGWHLAPLTGSYTHLPNGREYDGTDPHWPPGAGAPQWRIRDGLRLPCSLIAHVPRGTAYRGG